MSIEETTTKENTDKVDHAERNGRAWLKSIHEMVAKLDAENDDEDKEDILETITQSVLSVGVRDSSFHTPGDVDFEPDEFEILLSTGGPAAKIVGDLDRYNQPENVRFEVQDWFKPWTRMELNAEDQEAVEKFAAEFWFGD